MSRGEGYNGRYQLQWNAYKLFTEVKPWVTIFQKFWALPKGYKKPEHLAEGIIIRKNKNKVTSIVVRSLVNDFIKLKSVLNEI